MKIFYSRAEKETPTPGKVTLTGIMEPQRQNSYGGQRFLSWDVVDCHVDLEEELHTITLQALEGEEGKHGDLLPVEKMGKMRIGGTEGKLTGGKLAGYPRKDVLEIDFAKGELRAVLC
uniref:Uncharacterized protein n=1 Tax=Anopheles farauti TaxID=69004 RepID=A0A182Q0R2_9DIPT